MNVSLGVNLGSRTTAGPEPWPTQDTLKEHRSEGQSKIFFPKGINQWIGQGVQVREKYSQAVQGFIALTAGAQQLDTVEDV